jgi:hypothetical protein
MYLLICLITSFLEGFWHPPGAVVWLGLMEIAGVSFLLVLWLTREPFGRHK